MKTLFILLCNLAILGFLPFLFVGVINRVKSFWAGRQGPPVLQSWYDFVKLLHKGEVISPTTSYVFRIAPSINLAATLLAGLLVPLTTHQSLLDIEGNLVLFVYILAFGKFFSVLSALDTGSSFEGMGASREATFSSLAEPGFFIVLASAALLSGTFDFEKMFTFFQSPEQRVVSFLTVLLMALALFIMILVEGSRVPVDDPHTHLELTMIHEVMLLDNSGVDLAFLTYACALKMVLFAALIANLMIPAGVGVFISAVLLVGIMLTVAVCVGMVESLMARLRMSHVPQFLLLMTSIGLIVVCNIVLFTYRGIR